MTLKNYVLGRGAVYLAELDTDQNPLDFRYVGNSTELNITLETETLDLTNPDEGVNEVIDSVQTSITRSGTLTLDDIQRENLALFLFGADPTGRTVGQGADASDQTLTIPSAQVARLVARRTNGEWIPIGVTADNPVGYRNLSKLEVGSLTANTDYEVDLKRGRFKFLNTAAVGALSGNLTVTYARAADTTLEIKSGTSPRSVALKFFEENARGEDNDWSLPVVDLSPNGDLALKGDEWRAIPFSLAIQAPRADGVAAIYINGVPQ